MTISKRAERFVLRMLNKNKANNYLFRLKGEKGYDIRDKKSSYFIEVKGTSKRNLKEVNFRYLTNEEYKKALWCNSNGKRYEVFLVICVGKSNISIAKKISSKDFVRKLKQEKWWRLPIPKTESTHI